MKDEFNAADNYVVRRKPDPKLEKQFKKLIGTEGLLEGRYQEFFRRASSKCIWRFRRNGGIGIRG
jgi:hypothetical protein